MITVNDLEKAKEILEEQKTPFTVNDKNQLGFLETDIDLQTFITQLNTSDITIENIENQKVGAEKRYQELFAGEKSV